jgi:hypothetical protein
MFSPSTLTCPADILSRSHGRGIWLRLMEEVEEVLQGRRQFAAFAVDGRHRHGVTSVLKRHRHQPVVPPPVAKKTSTRDSLTRIDSATQRRHNDESRGNVPTPLIVPLIPYAPEPKPAVSRPQ